MPKRKNKHKRGRHNSSPEPKAEVKKSVAMDSKTFSSRFNRIEKIASILGFLLWVYTLWRGSHTLSLWLGVALCIGAAYLVWGFNRTFKIAAVALIVAGFVAWHYLPAPQPALQGWLSPGDEPTPPNACDRLPGKALLVICGNSAAWGTRFPQTIIKIGDERLLTMDKVKGRVAISGKFFSVDGRIVAELKNNRFYVNPNNYFRIERPDSHSLTVIDQQDETVLSVRYLNPHTIRFSGVVRGPLKTVPISSDRYPFSMRICAADSLDADFAF
jgi:hypothetical protein